MKFLIIARVMFVVAILFILSRLIEQLVFIM